MAEKIVVALGGNALQSGKAEPTAEAQLAVVKETPAMPFDVCGAMSQGYIGYHLQQALKFALKKRGKEIPVATILTQMVVDAQDPGFKNPTKPIGPFYSEEEAKALVAEKGYTVKEDAGRGWRRVVASPIPTEIVELDSVKRLFDSTIVITCGGGGIPVVRKEDGDLEGVAAVIDKDFAAELLAENIGADALMILTEVEKVAINFNKPNQENLGHLTYAEAEKYCEEGQFAPGSMLPKVQAAMKLLKDHKLPFGISTCYTSANYNDISSEAYFDMIVEAGALFVKANPDKKAIITSLAKAIDALEGKTGTVITFA